MAEAKREFYTNFHELARILKGRGMVDTEACLAGVVAARMTLDAWLRDFPPPGPPLRSRRSNKSIESGFFDRSGRDKSMVAGVCCTFSF